MSFFRKVQSRKFICVVICAGIYAFRPQPEMAYVLGLVMLFFISERAVDKVLKTIEKIKEKPKRQRNNG